MCFAEVVLRVEIMCFFNVDSAEGFAGMSCKSKR